MFWKSFQKIRHKFIFTLIKQIDADKFYVYCFHYFKVFLSARIIRICVLLKI